MAASPSRTALRALVDRAAIHDVLLRYARGVDRKDLSLVASCFTPDAAYEGSLARGDIGHALEALGTAMARYQTTMHLMGNQRIDLDGDRARCETAAVAFHRQGADGGLRDLTVGVRYVDDLVRRDGAWRICRRVARVEWRRIDPVEAHDG